MKNKLLSKSIFPDGIKDYETFRSENQKKINLLLNRFMRFSILIGPLMVIAIAFDIFHSVTYTSCILVTLLVALLSGIHYYMIRKNINSVSAAVIAFLALDTLLILMNSAHIGIYITWFAVPLVSLMFSDYKIYAIAVAINYCMMTVSTWIVAPYYTELRTDFHKPMQFFAERMGGYTIETAIMVAAGYALCRISSSYYRELIENYRSLTESKRQINEQIHISMTDELTKLFNRRCYYKDMEEQRDDMQHQAFSLFSIDLNGLKDINDDQGHAAGDTLLCGAADCLRTAVGSDGKVYRTGGDEFLAIVHTVPPAQVAEQIP